MLFGCPKKFTYAYKSNEDGDGKRTQQICTFDSLGKKTERSSLPFFHFCTFLCRGLQDMKNVKSTNVRFHGERQHFEINFHFLC